MIESCPTSASISLRGESFVCDAMHHMAEDSLTHDGWPHSSVVAMAIWASSSDLLVAAALALHQPAPNGDPCISCVVPVGDERCATAWLLAPKAASCSDIAAAIPGT